MDPKPSLTSSPADGPLWVRRLVRSRPHAAWLIPYLVYVGFFALEDKFSDAYLPWLIALRAVVSLYTVWLFRRYFSPWGRAHVGAAVGVGVLAAVGWVAGQHWLNGVEIGGWNLGDRLFLFPGETDVSSPHEHLSRASWVWQWSLRLFGVTLVVPFIEEIAWRGFLLRYMIAPNRFEKIPMGTFTWVSFMGTAMLSTLQHPDNWIVSIFCWMLYNGLMYWKKSLSCLIITHGVTNFVLYTYVLIYEDWMFW